MKVPLEYKNLVTKTTLTEYEISAGNLGNVRTINWSEIARVSGSGYSINLHSLTDDVVVTPNSSLYGYQEVVEQIGIKRPDLFNFQDYAEMSSNRAGLIIMPLLGILIAVVGFFVFYKNALTAPTIISWIVGLGFIVIPWLAPQAITLKNDTLTVGYLFGEKTFRAKEIAAIVFDCYKNRYGRPTANYYVQISTSAGGSLRIANMRPSLPIVYLVLKNWHAKWTNVKPQHAI